MLTLIVLIAFPFLIWSAYKNVRLSKESAAWPIAPGVVTASEQTKKGWRLQPKVTYSYSVDGKAYSSDKISFAALVPVKETESTLLKYPVSQPVHVHYQPGNPVIAILEPGPNRNVAKLMYAYIYLFVVIILVNIAYVGVGIWSAHQDGATPPAPTYGDKPTASTTPASSTPTSPADPELGNRLLREDAEKGNAQDQMYVGMWYLAGEHGYAKDPAEAVKWFQKSADQGNSDGETMLGNLYAKGIGVDKDLNKAVALFQKAADQNNPHACASLGYAYEKGVGGLPQDNAKAIEWYRKAGDDKQAKAALARLGAQ